MPEPSIGLSVDRLMSTPHPLKLGGRSSSTIVSQFLEFKNPTGQVSPHHDITVFLNT